MDWDAEIKVRLQKVIESREANKIAVFDADGTLWHGDLGEAFFQYQIENRLAPFISSMKNPWAHYRDLDKVDTAVASAWLAQINKGLKENEVKANAREFYQNHFLTKPIPLIKKLISDLHAHDFEVWICTASPRYSVEPCLEELEIPYDRLVGTEVEIEQVPGSEGYFTDRIVMPVPYKSGKKQALEKKLSGQPLLVVGNSLGDLDMLAWAKMVSLGVIYLPHLSPVETSEKALIIECQKRGWPLQIFNMTAK